MPKLNTNCPIKNAIMRLIPGTIPKDSMVGIIVMLGNNLYNIAKNIIFGIIQFNNEIKGIRNSIYRSIVFLVYGLWQGI